MLFEVKVTDGTERVATKAVLLWSAWILDASVNASLFLFGASCVSIVELPNFPVIITIMIITSFEAKIVVGRRVQVHRPQTNVWGRCSVLLVWKHGTTTYRSTQEAGLNWSTEYDSNALLQFCEQLILCDRFLWIINEKPNRNQRFISSIWLSL